MHTTIESLRLRSRDAHCERILTVEVQECTLRSGVGQTRSTKQIGDEGRKEGKKEGRKEGRKTVIKSNNPHLAGGEKVPKAWGEKLHVKGEKKKQRFREWKQKGGFEKRKKERVKKKPLLKGEKKKEPKSNGGCLEDTLSAGIAIQDLKPNSLGIRPMDAWIKSLSQGRH